MCLCCLSMWAGIATRYELDSPVIESRWGRDFPHPSTQALWSTQPPIQWVPGLSRGVKRPGRGVDHLPLSSAEVKGRVELYIYSPSGTSRPVLGWTLPFVVFVNAKRFESECGLIQIPQHLPWRTGENHNDLRIPGDHIRIQTTHTHISTEHKS